MINGIRVSAEDYALLLSKFPEQYREKLKLYTGEELFYVYKLAIFKPKRDPEGNISASDMTYMALRAKFMRWLKGEDKHPLYPSAWDKLRRFRSEFQAFIEESSVKSA